MELGKKRGSKFIKEDLGILVLGNVLYNLRYMLGPPLKFFHRIRCKTSDPKCCNGLVCNS